MKKELKDLSLEEINTLESMGVMYELYPDAKEHISDITQKLELKKIFKLVLASYDTYDIINVQDLIKEYMTKYEI